MRIGNSVALGALIVVAGCAHSTSVAERLGVAGWYRQPAGGLPQLAEPTTRFERATLGATADCAAVQAQVAGEGPVFVLVHGIKGDGTEWAKALPKLNSAHPAAVLLYRWVPWHDGDEISDGFAAGLSRLLECAPSVEGRLFVIAHSAGGVVLSFAAARVRVPARERAAPAARLFTVASPLAGTQQRARKADNAHEAKFMLDLGSAITRYPAAPGALAVVHLRTQFPSDQVMQPRGALLPNDPKVGVPGARMVEAPADQTHDGALTWACEHLADGTWEQWLSQGAVLPVGATP